MAVTPGPPAPVPRPPSTRPPDRNSSKRFSTLVAALPAGIFYAIAPAPTPVHPILPDPKEGAAGYARILAIRAEMPVTIANVRGATLEQKIANNVNADATHPKCKHERTV